MLALSGLRFTEAIRHGLTGFLLPSTSRGRCMTHTDALKGLQKATPKSRAARRLPKSSWLGPTSAKSKLSDHAFRSKRLDWFLSEWAVKAMDFRNVRTTVDP